MAISHDKIAKLVERAKTDDSQAFTELYELTYQKIYYIAFSILKDRYEAQDAVQETYIKIFASLHTLADDKLFVAWSNKIAYNVCLRYLEKLKDTSASKDASVSDEHLDRLIESDRNDPLLKAVKDERHRVLMKHISGLEPELKATVLFKYFEELKISEIALVMDCPEGTVKSRLNTAKRKLREQIRKKGTGDILLGAFGVLPLRQALQASASGVGLPPDVALDTLINALGTNNLSTDISFTPQGTDYAQPHSQAILRIGLVTAGLGGAAVITGVLLISPKISSVSLPEAYINQNAVAAVQVESLGRLEAFYAVSEETGARYEGGVSGDGLYQVELPENGIYTLYAVGINKRQTSMQIAVTCIDKELPVILDYSHSEQQLMITVQDDLSGVDYDSIYGVLGDGSILYPVESDSESGEVSFALPDSNFKIFISDRAGNQSQNQVTVRWS